MTPELLATMVTVSAVIAGAFTWVTALMIRAAISDAVDKIEVWIDAKFTRADIHDQAIDRLKADTDREFKAHSRRITIVERIVGTVTAGDDQG